MFNFDGVSKETQSNSKNFCDVIIGETFMTERDYEEYGLAVECVYIFMKISDKDAIKLNRDDLGISPLTAFVQREKVILFDLQISKISVK